MKRYEVNIFRPRTWTMRREVRVIFLVLAGWGGVTFGFQLLLAFLEPAFLTRLKLLGLPFHFWFTGQFLPLWFIILCVLFNRYIDHLVERRSRERDGIHDRR